jgi:large subunit ribosomal protein L33
MAKKKGEKREIIRLVCTEDGKHYVTTSKNKQNTPDKLELMKFNSNLRKAPHPLHDRPARGHADQERGRRAARQAALRQPRRLLQGSPVAGLQGLSPV